MKLLTAGLRAGGLFVLAFGLVLLAGADHLGAAGKADDAKKFTEDLKKGKDTKTKVTALDELGRLGQIQYKYAEAAIPEIFKFLKDKDTGLRTAAARAIGLIGPEDEKTVEELLVALKAEKDDGAKLAMVVALGQLGTRAKDAAGELRSVLKSADPKSKLAKEVKASIKSVTGVKGKNG